MSWNFLGIDNKKAPLTAYNIRPNPKQWSHQHIGLALLYLHIILSLAIDYISRKWSHQSLIYGRVKGSRARRSWGLPTLTWARTFMPQVYINPKILLVAKHAPSCFLRDHFVRTLLVIRRDVPKNFMALLDLAQVAPPGEQFFHQSTSIKEGGCI